MRPRRLLLVLLATGAACTYTSRPTSGSDDTAPPTDAGLELLALAERSGFDAVVDELVSGLDVRGSGTACGDDSLLHHLNVAVADAETATALLTAAVVRFRASGWDTSAVQSSDTIEPMVSLRAALVLDGDGLQARATALEIGPTWRVSFSLHTPRLDRTC